MGAGAGHGQEDRQIVSDARRYPAGEVSDARGGRYQTRGEVSRGGGIPRGRYQTHGGIPRGRYQTRGGIRCAELRERTRGGGGRAGGEIDSIRRAEEVSDARSFPAEEVSDARRYPAGEVYQTRGGIPRGRYQTRREV